MSRRRSGGGRSVFLFLIAICCALPLLFAARTSDAQTPPNETVVVQYDVPHVRAQGVGPDSPPPTLEEQGFRTLAVPPGMTRDEFLDQLRQDPQVLSAEPNATVYAADIPFDPYYDQHQAAYMELIKAPAAWALMNQSKDVVVAVLDSGLDLTHPEFAGRLWENRHDASNDGVDNDGSGCLDDRYGCRIVELTSQNMQACGYGAGSSAAHGNVWDDHRESHGTRVAGVLGAAGNNGEGLAGASWNVKLMPVKVLDCNGGGKMADVAQGINYATRMGASIINISITSEPGDETANAAVLRKAIEDARAAGVIIVAAAGNNIGTPQAPGYPAAYTHYENLMAVGASTATGTWADFSRIGPSIDIAAPGKSIVGALRTDIASNPYGTADGTSFATPLVSGLFALLKARNPSLPMQEYIRAVRESATPAPAAPHGQNWAGSGIVNFSGALERLPMTLSGDALHDWNYVAAGLDVRAFIDGRECGANQTRVIYPASFFVIHVRGEGEQAGCGAPGKEVRLTIGGQEAQPTFLWGGQNASLDVRGDVSTVSPAPGAIVVQTLGNGWNNIAHLDASGELPGALGELSVPWKSLLKWSPVKTLLDLSGAYLRFYRDTPDFVNDLHEVERYEAYWIDGGAANVATLNPSPASGRTVTLEPGWNNVVWTGSAAEVNASLAAISGKYTQVLRWNNATSSWLSYVPGRQRALQGFNGFFKFHVYWIHATERVNLTMP